MKRAKASEELVLDIKRTILSGKYAPGSQLPSERELAKKYNLSRVPVREAIEQLVSENILRTEPHVGTFVTDLYNVELLSKSMYQTSHIEEKILRESLINASAYRKRRGSFSRKKCHRQRHKAHSGMPLFFHK